MKKIIIFLAIVVGLFAAIAIVTNIQNSQKAEGNKYKKEDLDPATVDLLDDPNYQNVILPDELEKKLGDKEDVTVYFYSPTCPHCKKTTPMLAPLAEDMGVDMVQYNLLEFEQGWNDYQIESTPTLVHFENGKEADRLVGSQPEEVYKSFFEQYVKE
ncbi:thioredoxin family protein [Rossellomorea aquimaris]|uniref:Thiol reductase thioredoxin n=1 Tax=Rossellomorea aquimaris TaxID=189382 RepID=A0A1J6X579_9BACI|nr:thioredoxin family protein [Rossellomorea aquimaris]OIU73289.1 thiol reductase thioredoxin [Rossellomorea aquimaris]